MRTYEGIYTFAPSFVPSYEGILNFNQVVYTLSDNLSGIALG